MGALLLCTCACFMHALFFSFHIYSFDIFFLFLMVSRACMCVCVYGCRLLFHSVSKAFPVAMHSTYFFVAPLYKCVCVRFFRLCIFPVIHKWMKNLNIFPMRCFFFAHLARNLIFILIFFLDSARVCVSFICPRFLNTFACTQCKLRLVIQGMCESNLSSFNSGFVISVRLQNVRGFRLSMNTHDADVYNRNFVPFWFYFACVVVATVVFFFPAFGSLDIFCQRNRWKIWWYLL